MNIINIINKNKLTFSYNKLMAIIIFLIVFSFTIETFFSLPDITIPLLLTLIAIDISYTMKTKRLYKPYLCDIYIFLFILYLIFHSLIKSDIKIVIGIVIGSIGPYFLGRYVSIDEDLYYTIRKIVNIVGWIIIIKLTIEYINTTDIKRVTIEGSNVIANGELIGIFALTNLFNMKGLNKDLVSIFNYIIGILTCLIIIGSRGTVLAIIVTTIIMYIYINGFDFKIIFSIFAIIIGYLILFSENSLLLQMFPILDRFTISGILNDQSMIGGSGIGRFQLYEESIVAFKQNPLFGVGAGKIHSHNIFLEIISTLGILPLCIFILWLTDMLLKCNKVCKNGAIIVSLFIYTFIYRQSSFALNSHKSLFMFAGMIVTIYNIKIWNGSSIDNRRRKI